MYLVASFEVEPDSLDASLEALDSSELIKIAHNATSSRVLDVLLDSETVPIKVKRSFVQSFIGNYHLLVDDRIGSRVGDRCFAFADTYLKVSFSIYHLF